MLARGFLGSSEEVISGVLWAADVQNILPGCPAAWGLLKKFLRGVSRRGGKRRGNLKLAC